MRKLDQEFLNKLETEIQNKTGITPKLMKLRNFIKKCCHIGYDPKYYDYFILDTIKFCKVKDIEILDLKNHGIGIAICFKLMWRPSSGIGNGMMDTILISRFPNSKLSKAWDIDSGNDEFTYYDHFLEDYDYTIEWVLEPVK